MELVLDMEEIRISLLDNPIPLGGWVHYSKEKGRETIYLSELILQLHAFFLPRLLHLPLLSGL